MEVKFLNSRDIDGYAKCCPVLAPVLSGSDCRLYGQNNSESFESSASDSTITETQPRLYPLVSSTVDHIPTESQSFSFTSKHFKAGQAQNEATVLFPLSTN
ncbi:hypothetical protein J6590_059912 [Homalodisca vitripennis]|nr:hypothetical protein J6590_059912 [Homalodisca vitripennis]